MSISEEIDRRIEKARQSTLEQVDALKEQFASGAKSQEQMAEAFNRIASALEDLTGEVKALRAELKPDLNKTKKLQPPVATGV